jgi:hypothetical protein
MRDMADAALKATSGTGIGPNLTAYPNLVYAPTQWGDHVGCQSSGMPAADVAAYVADAPASTTTQQVADALKLSLGEVLDSVRYIQDNPVK